MSSFHNEDLSYNVKVYKIVIILEILFGKR